MRRRSGETGVEWPYTGESSWSLLNEVGGLRWAGAVREQKVCLFNGNSIRLTTPHLHVKYGELPG